MRSWLELKQMPFLVAAIIIRATKPDALALDDLFLGLSGASYTCSRLRGCQAISQKAIVILHQVVQLSSCACLCHAKETFF